MPLVEVVAALLVVASVAAQPLVLEQHTALMTVFDGIGATTKAIKPEKTYFFFSFFLQAVAKMGCVLLVLPPTNLARSVLCLHA